MNVSAEIAVRSTAIVMTAMVMAGGALAQTTPAQGLVASLRKGGHVLVMRHASSPAQTPDKQTANADNVKLERQLDEAGRNGSAAMGTALRALKISIGDVLSSPAYRALETVRLAQVPGVKTYEELGDGGQSMQSVAEAHGRWLRQRAVMLPQGSNTLIVTHMPNIALAFPEWDAVEQGEAVVIGRDDKGTVRALGRIKSGDWAGLR